MEISNLDINDQRDKAVECRIHEVLLNRKYFPVMVTSEIKEEKKTEYLYTLLNIKRSGIATFACTDCESRVRVQVGRAFFFKFLFVFFKVDSKILQVKSYQRRKCPTRKDTKTMFQSDIEHLLDIQNYKLVQNSLSKPHTCSGADDLHELRLFTSIKKFLNQKMQV